ncbi:YbaK/prolyl-tRNA synthetase associated domain-containing protein [Arthrobacter crystallopoietes BAB-32]|uniref:YbaK/prolyl-tRNA synthetase associated domain-containing protein n=1 Tax=Arthrobacter crystallopoietes BAB-32 TaxID=1246476 RepID=N1V088_9MICC|nr:YbaK/EbsC family protein [Arthrobacter crystallopoietes]EMY33444.1 YbaK/prolyl-tRNA synthetase associated domain-containing protein [Arthrobacter crystallopoietes BAB-32]
MSEAAGLDRFLADARGRGIDVDVVPRPPARSLAEAADLLGIQPADIVKSLVVKHKDGSFLFALVPGDRQISWPKLRALLGVNKLSLPPADVAFEATGYPRGTITPLGSTTPWPVFADEAIAGRRISMGAGDHGHSAFLQADDLIAALNATTADISDPA